MAATNNQKLKLLYILKFLQENTDENHIAHAEDIKLYLLNHGIAAERKYTGFLRIEKSVRCFYSGYL